MSKLWIAIVIVLSAVAVRADEKIVVGQPSRYCKPNYARIQDAITAARPGSTVFVCAGLYNEQPVVSKPLTLILDKYAIIRPLGVLPNGVSLSSGTPFAALLLATNSRDVRVFGGQLDGAEAAITGCAPRLYGIVYQN